MEHLLLQQHQPPGSNKVSYMVLAGGGGGAGCGGGGGGAGGFREGKCSINPYTASPLNAPSGLPVSAQAYPITVGGGGSGTPASWSIPTWDNRFCIQFFQL